MNANEKILSCLTVTIAILMMPNLKYFSLKQTSPPDLNILGALLTRLRLQKLEIDFHGPLEIDNRKHYFRDPVTLLQKFKGLKELKVAGMMRHNLLPQIRTVVEQSPKLEHVFIGFTPDYHVIWEFDDHDPEVSAAAPVLDYVFAEKEPGILVKERPGRLTRYEEWDPKKAVFLQRNSLKSVSISNMVFGLNELGKSFPKLFEDVLCKFPCLTLWDAVAEDYRDQAGEEDEDDMEEDFSEDEDPYDMLGAYDAMFGYDDGLDEEDYDSQEEETDFSEDDVDFPFNHPPPAPVHHIAPFAGPNFPAPYNGPGAAHYAIPEAIFPTPAPFNPPPDPPTTSSSSEPPTKILPFLTLHASLSTYTLTHLNLSLPSMNLSLPLLSASPNLISLNLQSPSLSYSTLIPALVPSSSSLRQLRIQRSSPARYTFYYQPIVKNPPLEKEAQKQLLHSFSNIETLCLEAELTEPEWRSWIIDMPECWPRLKAIRFIEAKQPALRRIGDPPVNSHNEIQIPSEKVKLRASRVVGGYIAAAKKVDKPVGLKWVVFGDYWWRVGARRKTDGEFREEERERRRKEMEMRVKKRKGRGKKRGSLTKEEAAEIKELLEEEEGNEVVEVEEEERWETCAWQVCEGEGVVESEDVGIGRLSVWDVVATPGQTSLVRFGNVPGM